MCKRFLSVLVAVTMVFLFTVPAMASLRASDQIFAYSTDVKALSNGRIALDFSITGTQQMQTLGCEKIVVYEKNGNLWYIVASYDRYDSGMSKSNSGKHTNTLYYNNAYAGAEYKVEITVFAEDSRGSDSRTQTHYLTAI